MGFYVFCNANSEIIKNDGNTQVFYMQNVIVTLCAFEKEAEIVELQGDFLDLRYRAFKTSGIGREI